MTNYVGFINSMLELRNQRLKESIAKAQLEQEQTEMFAKQMSQAGSSLGRMFEQMGANRAANRQDMMANQIMNESFPQPSRAQAVDPSMQGPADSAAQGMPGFYRGGTDELGMRMKMAGLRDRQMDSNLARERFDYGKETDTRDYNRQVGRDIVNDTFKTQDDIRADQAAIAREKEREEDNKRAQESAKQSTLGKDFNNLRSYQDSMKVHINDMRDAPDKATHDRAALSAHNLWAAANKAGLDVGEGPPEIAPFMTPLQKVAIQEQQQKVAEAQTAMNEAKRKDPTFMEKSFPGITEPLGINYKDQAIQQAQERYKMEQGVLDSMQKGGESFDPNAAAPAAAPRQKTMSAQEASAKLGRPVKARSIITLKDGTEILVQ